MLNVCVRGSAGFSLTELMIGSALGLVIIAGALQLYITNIRANADSLRISRLNQELRAVTELMRNELRRSGYWAGEPGLEHPLDNPFQQAENDVRTGAVVGEAAESCVLYSYDLNADKQVGVGPSGIAGTWRSTANLEQFGLRLRNGQVQLRNGGRSFDCQSGSWQAVSDPNTRVTHLEFRIDGECINLDPDRAACVAGDPALLRRKVHVSIAAEIRSAPEIRQTLTSQIAIANDKLLEHYP